MLALRLIATRRLSRSYTTMTFTYEVRSFLENFFFCLYLIENGQEAVDKIISLQTNAATLEQLRKMGPRMNDRSLPEMRAYFKRIGYEVKLWRITEKRAFETERK